MNRTIGLLRKFQQELPRPFLITIYKAFIRSHLDYGDVIFDQTFNNSFHQRLESIQYNAALVITGAIRGTSKEKLYQELGFKSLQSRRCFRKLSLFDKIIKNEPRSLSSFKASLKTLFSIHHHRMEQIRFEYSLFSFLQIFQKKES